MPAASARPVSRVPPPLSAEEIDQAHTYGMRAILEPDAPTTRIVLTLGETVNAASVLGGAAERWTWKKWKGERALLERCVGAACETIKVPLAADRISPAVLHRKLAINTWSETASGPVDQARLVLRVDPLAAFLFVRGYFGFERLERLPNSGDLTFMYRRYEKAIKALPNKAYRDTLRLLAHVPEPWLIEEFRKEVGRRGLSRAALAWLDQKGLQAPVFRYFCRQGRATEKERWAALGEVRKPEEFKQLRALARRFGDRAMQSDLGEFAHARQSLCGLADPPVVTDEYRRTCQEWSRLARQYPKPR
jgi:hypothetical protein